MQNALEPGRDTAPAFLRPPPCQDDIKSQLERILISPEFPHIGRSAAFLTYVTEEALAGRGDRLKGYSIAIEVFRRDEGFTQDDPVVRIEAGRLRRALERYYLVAGQNDAVRIDIPKGGYVPAFTWNNLIADAPLETADPLAPPRPLRPSTRTRGRGLLMISIGLLAAFSAMGLTVIASPYLAASSKSVASLLPPEGPTLAIAPFANLGEGQNAELYTVGLTEELLTALPRFKEIRVFGRETSNSPPVVGTSQIRGELGARFLLERFRIFLNRVRFPNRHCSDSLMLAGWRPASHDRTVIQ